MIIRNILQLSKYLKISYADTKNKVSAGIIRKDIDNNFRMDDIEKILSELNERRAITKPVWLHVEDSAGNSKYYNNGKHERIL